MKYSVYDPNRRTYDYYDGPGPKGTHAESPRVRSSSSLGATPEDAAWPLPMSAVKVGSGEMPMGRIASIRGGIAMGDVDTKSVGIGVVLAYVAWRVLK